MGLLEKFRRIMAADPTRAKREEARLQRDALWEGNYDRSFTPKDGWGGIPKEPSEHGHDENL